MPRTKKRPQHIRGLSHVQSARRASTRQSGWLAVSCKPHAYFCGRSGDKASPTISSRSAASHLVRSHVAAMCATVGGSQQGRGWTGVVVTRALAHGRPRRACSLGVSLADARKTGFSIRSYRRPCCRQGYPGPSRSACAEDEVADKRRASRERLCTMRWIGLDWPVPARGCARGSIPQSAARSGPGLLCQRC